MRSATAAVFRREFASLFATPLAFVFLAIFLVLSGAATFYLGHLFERGQADLRPFFDLLPWLYLLLVPSLSMRLWAEERQSGSIELLLTLPVTTRQAVVAKFLASWAFTGMALALTFPLWITIGWLGQPDHGAIAAGYAGSLLLGGAFVAVGGLFSAVTRSQVIAFVLGLFACLLLLVAGSPLVTDPAGALLGTPLVETIANLSFLAHFGAIARGVIDLRDVVYFALVIGFGLMATVVVVDLRKAA